MNVTQEKICIYDVETTGDDPNKDQICQIAVLVCDKDFRPQRRITSLVKPTIPIAPEATAVHGITDEDVEDAPSFLDIWRKEKLYDAFAGALVVGFNSERFDDIIMINELDRSGVIYDFGDLEKLDVFKMYHKFNRHTLVALVKRFLNVDMGNSAHDAFIDAKYTANLLRHFMSLYEEDLPETTEGISTFLEREKRPDYVDSKGLIRFRFGVATFGFGKCEGKTLEEVSKKDPGYLKWMSKNFDNEEIRAIADEALRGRYPAVLKEDNYA